MRPIRSYDLLSHEYKLLFNWNCVYTYLYKNIYLFEGLLFTLLPHTAFEFLVADDMLSY